MKKGNSQLDKQYDRISQRIEQRSKTNNYPAPQNNVQTSTISEDTKALAKLKEQLAQLSVKHQQESAKVETVQLESSRKNMVINKLISDREQGLADKDRVIEEQATILIQKDKKILELQQRMEDLLEQSKVLKNEKTVVTNTEKSSQKEKNSLTDKNAYYQEIKVGEMDEIVVLESIDYTIDGDILSDFVVIGEMHTAFD